MEWILAEVCSHEDGGEDDIKKIYERRSQPKNSRGN